MSWTYSGSPGSSPLDTVRFLVQDTEVTDQLLTNEEINFVITTWSPLYDSLFLAAAMCAEALAAKFAREVAVSGDGVSVGVQDLQQKYDSLATSLRDMHKQAVGAGVVGDFAGGTIFSDYFDSTIKPLSFGKGMTDNPRAGQQDFGGTSTYPGDAYPEYADWR